MTRRPAAVAIALLAFVTLAFHLATNGRYGFFRDELYFLVCGQRLDWGYVDQPAGIALVARLATELAGSLVGIRVPAALAAAGLVALSGAFAVRLGGGVFAAVLAGLTVALAPVFAVGGHLLTMNAFQPLVWTAISWTALSLVEDGRRATGRWGLLGLLVGVGFNFKYDVAFWLLGLGIGVLLTRDGRRALSWRGIGIAGLVAAVLLAPNVLWQVRHGLPMLELLRNGQLRKNAPFEPVGFLLQQLLLVGPLAAPVWLLGLLSGLTRRDRPTAVLSVTFLATLALMFLGKAKAYYVAPAYPTLLALGAVEIETRIRSAAARWTVASLVGAAGVLLLPLFVPVLPVDTLLRYQAALHFQPPRDERHEFNALPQHLADEFGWPGIVDALAAASARLTPAERATGAIYTFNYGAGVPRTWPWAPHRGVGPQPVLALGAAGLEPRSPPGHRRDSPGALPGLSRGGGGRAHAPGPARDALRERPAHPPLPREEDGPGRHLGGGEALRVSRRAGT